MGVYDVRLVNADKRTDAEKSKDTSPNFEIVLGVRATPHDVVPMSHQPVASHKKDDLGELIWTATLQSDSAYLNLLLNECKSPRNTTSLMYAGTEGRTPLHEAAQSKSIGIVKALLEAGANVVYADTEGRTPLHGAVQSKSIETMKALLEAADTKGRTPLHEAVQSKSTDIVKALLEAGANVMNADTEGRAPQHEAVQSESIVVVKALLEASDTEGLTPLHEAVQSGSIDIVKVLLEAGANLVNADTEGRTALHRAVQTQSTNIVNALLEAGAGVMTLDKGGKVRCSFCTRAHSFSPFLSRCPLHRPHVAMTLADAPAFVDAHRPL